MVKKGIIKTVIILTVSIIFSISIMTMMSCMNTTGNDYHTNQTDNDNNGIGIFVNPDDNTVNKETDDNINTELNNNNTENETVLSDNSETNSDNNTETEIIETETDNNNNDDSESKPINNTDNNEIEIPVINYLLDNERINIKIFNLIKEKSSDISLQTLTNVELNNYFVFYSNKTTNEMIRIYSNNGDRFEYQKDNLKIFGLCVPTGDKKYLIFATKKYNNEYNNYLDTGDFIDGIIVSFEVIKENKNIIGIKLNGDLWEKY